VGATRGFRHDLVDDARRARSGAVIFMASAASALRSSLRKRIEAQPSAKSQSRWRIPASRCGLPPRWPAPARAAFANDHGDDGHRQPGHDLQVLGHCLGLSRSSASMPGNAPGVSSRQMTGLPKRAARSMRRLACDSLGFGHAHVARELLLGGAPLLLAQAQDGHPFEEADAAIMAGSSAKRRSHAPRRNR